MPADPTHNPTIRRTNRKSTNEDDLELRRARGEISCAECRRLKLKCDRKLPCGSCVRRGCPSICPNGSLSNGQGTRFVLSDTAQLHTKIGEMGQRIQQLEDALSIFQSTVSNEVHPLLREELLAIKFAPEITNVPPTTRPKQQEETPIAAMGTMSIGDRGEWRYFGSSGGSHSLLSAHGSGNGDSDTVPSVPLPPEVSQLSALFPFGGSAIPIDKPLEFIFPLLPPEPRAWSLLETYMEHASWGFKPVGREELVAEFLTPTYKAVKDWRASGHYNAQKLSVHKMAVIFMVFSIGALMDLTLEPFNSESHTYYHLGRCCLSFRSIFDSPELATIQAVMLMAKHYTGLAGIRETVDISWSLMMLGQKLAQSVGLHRDPSRWIADPQTIQRRRALFWEIFAMEHLYCLALGRPPSIRLSYVDCKFPELTDECRKDTPHGFWKYEFARDIFAELTELTLTADPPKYAIILEFDRKLREKSIPSVLKVPAPEDSSEAETRTFMERALFVQLKTITSLYLHRTYFAQAMIDHPANPLLSPYAPSVLAAYSCASGLIKSCLVIYNRQPDLCKRWWGIWIHLFTAAIVVGSIVSRAPSSSLAPNAFIELGLACDLYEKGGTTSDRGKAGLGILQRLRADAFKAYSHFRAGNTPHPSRTNQVPQSLPTDDEIALFGGQAKLVAPKEWIRPNLSRPEATIERAAGPLASHAHPSAEVSTNTPEFTRSNPDDGILPVNLGQQYHPSLAEYLATFSPAIPAAAIRVHSHQPPTESNTESINQQRNFAFSDDVVSNAFHTSYGNIFVDDTTEQSFDMSTWEMPMDMDAVAASDGIDLLIPGGSMEPMEDGQWLAFLQNDAAVMGVQHDPNSFLGHLPDFTHGCPGPDL